MIGHRHYLARMQSDFYRDCYYKVLNWLFLEIVIMLVLILFIIYHIIFHPTQLYFATTTTGKLLGLYPGR